MNQLILALAAALAFLTAHDATASSARHAGAGRPASTTATPPVIRPMDANLPTGL
jgi:hypothetical protein